MQGLICNVPTGFGNWMVSSQSIYGRELRETPQFTHPTGHRTCGGASPPRSCSNHSCHWGVVRGEPQLLRLEGKACWVDPDDDKLRACPVSGSARGGSRGSQSETRTLYTSLDGLTAFYILSVDRANPL